MSTFFTSTDGSCGCEPDACGTFVNTVKLYPPSTGYDCPYVLDLSNIFQGAEPPPAAPECSKLVSRTIHCPKSLIDLRNELLLHFPLSAFPAP